jgi:hypothetical protein
LARCWSIIPSTCCDAAVGNRFTKFPSCATGRDASVRLGCSVLVTLHLVLLFAAAACASGRDTVKKYLRCHGHCQ